MNRSDPASQKAFYFHISILILPLLMFHWALPFLSQWTLGNDYPRFPIWQQMELMLSLKSGSFPLYVPGFAVGQSASALTLGQLFHPISHLAAAMPGYWSGKALEWNTLLRLLSLGLAHLALFQLIRQFRLSSLSAFAISMVTVYNLRMLDLFRYGASLESWTGYLFLCAAIGSYFLRPTKCVGPLVIIGSTYWLICSGHPQMMYYGLLGAGLFAVIIPFFMAVMLPDQQVDLRKTVKFWSRVAILGFLGFLLAFAYILPFYFDFVLTNAGRVAHDYAWADMYRDTFIGTINNFFYPLQSDVSGSFGGSSLFIVAALVPILRIFRIRVPPIIWVVWSIALLGFLHMQGARTPVHFLAWKYLPFASSFRVAGRISIILPILFMLILSWLMRAEPDYLRSDGGYSLLSPRVILGLTALILIGAYAFLPDSIVSNTTVFSAFSIREIPPWVKWFTLMSGAVTICAFVCHGYSPKARLYPELLLCIFMYLQLSIILPHGTWVEVKKDTQNLQQMLSAKQKDLGHLRFPGNGMESLIVARQTQRSFVEPYLGILYRQYVVVNSNDEAYEFMETDRRPELLVVEHYLPEQDFPGTGKTSDIFENKVTLTYNSPNRLVFEVEAAHPSFFGMSYPFTKNWQATIENREVPVYRANGAAHAVRVGAGKSRVEFRYWSPAAFWGMLVSCAVFVLIGILLGFSGLKKPYGVIITLLTLSVGAGTFILWYQSLYTGNNFDTRYVWNENISRNPSNLAYGRKTSMSSLLHANYPYLFSSSEAVNGTRKAGSGFITKFERQPWWFVDLNRPMPIGYLKIYESRKGPKFNRRPVKIIMSDNGNDWHTIGLLPDKSTKGPYILRFEEPKTARYVRVQATDYCHFAFDEVEIYPPVENHQ